MAPIIISWSYFKSGYVELHRDTVAQVDLHGLAVDLSHRSLDVRKLPPFPELLLRPRLGPLRGEHLSLDGDDPSNLESHSAIFGEARVGTLDFTRRLLRLNVGV